MQPKEHYEKHGYAVIRGLFNDREIALIDSHVDPVFTKWVGDNESEIFNNRLVNMHSLTHPKYFEGRCEARVKFFEAIAPTKLTDALEAMFGPGIHFHNTQLFFNPSNKARLPYWHRDMQYSPIDDEVQRAEQHRMLSLHVRIPLVAEKGVEVVRGSHKRWDTELERAVRLELNGHKNSEPLPGSVLIDLSPGDVLIFSVQMLHRGNYDLNPTRKALDLCVGKYHPISSSFLDEKVLPDEEEMNNIENYQWYRLAKEIVARK